MRTFILGVGAQKAGTSWLFRQIIKSGNFSKGFSKEYHFFDAEYLDGYEYNIKNINRRISNYPFQKGDDFIEKSEKIMLSFHENKNNYFDYFDSILTTNDAFTSDITPSYAALSSEALSEIKHEFNKRNIALKIIFIMREPITRLESAIRMELRRNNTLRTASSSVATDKIYQYMNSEQNIKRSNYSYTCQQIDEVFTPEEVFYGFYESLFSKKEIDRLSSFLNMSPLDFDPLSVVNSTKKPFKYKKKDIENFKNEVLDTYQFVSERFGFDLSKWDDSLRKITAKF